MKQNSSDVAYDYIRQRIVSGEFAPGASLLTHDLARQIGVSRTPVKDALRQLETDGLVVIHTRLGAKVRSMNEDEFRELCEMRLALEGYAAGLAARNRTRGNLQEIEAVLRLMVDLKEKIERLNEEGNHFSEVLHQDVLFHVTILSAAHNNTIKSQILQLHLINRVMAHPVPVQAKNQKGLNTLRETIQSHTKIYEAIKAGDETKARALMEKHIQEVIDDHLQLTRKPAAAGARELTAEEMNYLALLPQ